MGKGKISCPERLTTMLFSGKIINVAKRQMSVNYGPLAQLVRATGSYPVGPGFESLMAHHFITYYIGV